jgi:hypothetical protein
MFLQAFFLELFKIFYMTYSIFSDWRISIIRIVVLIQHNMAKKQGDPIQICVQGEMVCDNHKNRNFSTSISF